MVKLEAPVDFNVSMEAVSRNGKLLRFLKKLGFGTVVLAYNTLDSVCDLRRIRRETVEVSKNLGLNVFLKVNIVSENRGRLKRCLRKIRDKVDVVSVNPRNLDIARFSGRDGRVDTVFFTYDGLVKFYDETQAKLMSQNGTALEIIFNNLWETGKLSYRTFFFLKRTLYYTLKHRVPIVVSSGASKSVEVKSPRQLTSLLEVLGVPESYSKLSIITYPLTILKRNIHKKSRKHVRRGVDLA